MNLQSASRCKLPIEWNTLTCCLSYSSRLLHAFTPGGGGRGKERDREREREREEKEGGEGGKGR